MAKPSAKIKESQLHIQILHLLRLDFAEDDLLVFHCPNGGVRDKREAAKLKAMGVLPGVADLICHWPVKAEIDGFVGLLMETGYIEIKTPDGYLSPEQGRFRNQVTAMGGRYFVARSYEQARDKLIKWGAKCSHRVNFHEMIL